MQMVIFNGISKGIDKIEIAKFFMNGGSDIKIVDDSRSIGKIIKLLRQPFKKFDDFVDSPMLSSFRIELFRQGKMVFRIPVAGNFVKKKDDWYLMTNPLLLLELARQTRSMSLKNARHHLLE